jgi:hypothetical protein
MVLEYLNFRKSKDGVQTIVSDAPKSPILNDEDEKFLERLTSEAEGKAPPLPERPVVIFDTGEKVVGKDAQVALMNGAEKVPLPQSPPAVTPFVAPNSAENKASQKAQEYLSYVRNLPQRFTNKVSATVSVFNRVRSYFSVGQGKGESWFRSAGCCKGCQAG